MKLFKSQIKHLQRVRNMLKIHCTMNGRQVILQSENKNKIDEAVNLIERASLLLDEIE